MSVFLVPLTAEIAAFVSEGLVEIGLTNTTAGLAGGLVAGQVGSVVSNGIASGLEEAAKQVLGVDNYIQKMKDLEKVKNDSAFVYNLLQNTENFQTSGIVRPKAQTPAQTQTPTPTPAQPRRTFNTFTNGATSDSTGSKTYTQLGTILKNVVQIVSEDTKNPSSNTILDTSTMLADLLTEHSTSIAETDGPLDQHKSVVELVGNDPKRLSMVQRLSSYYAEKVQDNTEEYKKIKEIYNGSGISPETVVMTETDNEWIFMQYDETKTLKTLVQKKKAKTIPAIYGIFGGPLSPNNSKPINYPDNCFMHHDEAYSEGYFLKKSDQILVARLLARKDLWPLEDVSILNSIVIYFQTIGRSLSWLKGSLSNDVASKSIDDDSRDDIFPYLIPEASMNIEDYKIERYNFYKNLEDKIVENHQTKSVMARPQRIISKSIINRFENIQIEIL